jgi:hypothetical protein
MTDALGFNLARPDVDLHGRDGSVDGIFAA